MCMKDYFIYMIVITITDFKYFFIFFFNFLMYMCSKHFVNVANNIYRFNPIRLENDETKRFHGLDERIGVKNYIEMISFMKEFVESIDRS